MKVWKLVSGIFSTIFPLVILLQSCAAGVGGALQDDVNTAASGGGGMILAIFMLAGGIVSIVTRNNEGKGGNIALVIIFGLGALIGLSMGSGSAFKDLIIWGGWCGINVITAVISMFLSKKKSQ